MLSDAAMPQLALLDFCLQWARPEDGSWDPSDPLGSFYFAATANVAGVTKMWNLKFDDVKDPTKGGYAKVVVNGKRGEDGPPAVPNQDAPVMMDNIVVHKGFTYMQVGGGALGVAGGGGGH
jgi:hypothetical protein